MKTSLIVLSISFFGFTQAVEAKTKWAQSPFWSAPMKSVFFKELLPASNDLTSACQVYNKSVAVFKNYELTLETAKKIDLRRKLPLSSQSPFDLNLKAVLVLDKLNSIIIEELVDESNSDSALFNQMHSISAFPQTAAMSGIMLQEWKSYEVEYSEDSLMSFSDKLKLDESKLVFHSLYNKASLEVFGLDLACDLISGKARIKISAPGYVKLTQESSISLASMYENKVSKVISDILSSTTESEMMKAAKLGYRLGIQFENEGGDEKSTELKIKSLMGLLFKSDSLTPTKYLSKDQNRFSINFDSGLDVEDMTLFVGGIK